MKLGLSPGGYIKNYLEIQIKLHWWIKSVLKLFTIKMFPRFGRNHGPSSGEVKEKLCRSTVINKIKIQDMCHFFLARVKCKYSLGSNGIHGIYISKRKTTALQKSRVKGNTSYSKVKIYYTLIDYIYTELK